VGLGHPVTAVDESPAMLAHVTGAERVRADIRSLALGRRFPVVVMASHLANTADDADRAALLAACARYVAPDGTVLLETHEPGWAPVESATERDGVAFALRDVRRDGPFVEARVEYRNGGRSWSHPFRVRVLSDEELDRELRAAGLAMRRRLGPHEAWVAAAPTGVGPPGGG
jgi:SAM-dependent methyltransferase